MIAEEALVRENSPRNYLWVEGSDDYHVCIQLLQHYHISEQRVVVVKKEGIENVLKDLKVQLLASEETRLDIIADADENFLARWQALRNILIGLGYSVPTSPQQSGTILNHEEYSSVGF